MDTKLAGKLQCGNGSFTAFTVSELLKENQHGGKSSFTQIKITLWGRQTLGRS